MRTPSILTLLFFGISYLRISSIGISCQDYEYEERCTNTTTSSTTPTTTTVRPKKFDYIIVGAGTTGCLLASRLSDHANCGQRILVLEAGKEPLPEAQIPAYAGELQHTEMNWGYTFEPQENFAYGIEDFRVPCPRGKALGGTTAINNMLHIRGNPDDFDHWLPDQKSTWEFKDFKDYMKKFENYTVCYRDDGVHGDHGNLTVEDVKYRTTASKAFVKAFLQYGYSYVDYNGLKQIGVSYIHAQTRNGLRESSFTAFLRRKLSRKNLIVITEARVTKILIDGRRRARGVVYVQNGVNNTVETSQELVIAAGAINTPHLLMLSGIGPKTYLKKVGIRAISDLPVGRKLYDHLSFLGLTYTVNESVTFSWEELTSKKSLCLLKNHRSGPLTSTANIEAIAMVDTRSLVNESDALPNVAFLFVGLAPNADGGSNIKRRYRISDDMYQKFWGKVEGRSAFIVAPVLLRAKSKGTVTLRSPHYTDPPLIKGNFYTDEEGQDMKVMLSAVRFVQLLMKMPSFVRYNATLLTPIPGCEKYPYDSDSYWECGLRQLPVTLYNPHSTCAMGKERNSVVTPTLKVRGVQRLRVVDASVIPQSFGGDLSTVGYAIAEKMADILLGRMTTCEAKHHKTTH